MVDNCIFCKIIAKQIPATIVFEDEQIIAFKDIHPKAKVHLLIVPKKHIATFKEISANDGDLLGHMLIKTKEIAEEHHLNDYKLSVNVGQHGGQEVFHLHLHLMSAPN
ncbi:HIT domain-containing protein [Candidatus Peregrinibacteria bacterium]|nr:HIT domain-containing protein [Candidatus Peregrinibacteria bacterium]